MPPLVRMKGMAGLAMILKYAMEHKFYLEFNGLQDVKKADQTLLTGLGARIQRNFQTKMHELLKVKTLINTSKYAKRELLANMLQEQNFKIHLRAESNAQ